MSTFSNRYGYSHNQIQFEMASDTLKKRIFASFYKQEFDYYDTLECGNYTTGVEDMMVEMGVPYKFPNNSIIKEQNATVLQKYIVESKEWYVILGIRVSKISTSANAILRLCIFPYIVSVKRLICIIPRQIS